MRSFDSLDCFDTCRISPNKLTNFILLTAIGSAVWNIALIGAGAVLKDQWDRVGDYVGVFQWVVILAIVVFVVRFVISLVKRRRTGAAS